MVKKEEGYETECLKCGYKWFTKSVLLNINCPSCLRKTENTQIIKKRDDANAPPTGHQNETGKA